MSWMAAAGIAVSVIGSASQASGAKKQSKAAALQAQKQAEAALVTGQQRQAVAGFEAAQLNQNAGQTIAASQRDAADAARGARLAESRALALAAASGGGASSPTVMNIIADLAGEGAYRRSVALYGGEERARSMRMAAAGREWEGQLALEAGEAGYDTGMGVAKSQIDAGNIAAGGSIVKGGLSMFEKYGMGGPASSGGMPSGLGYGTIDPTMAGAGLPF